MDVEPVAGRPAAPDERGRAVGASLLGVVATVLVVMRYDAALEVGAFVVVVALVYGLGTWRLSRPRLRRILDAVEVVEGPGPSGRAVERAAFEHGLRTGIVLGALLLAFVLLLDSLVEPDVLVVWSLGLGLAPTLLMQAREVRTWEQRTGRRLHRRPGARRVAWTPAQASGRLVAVRREPLSAG